MVGVDADERSQILLKAMISAEKADGHIDRMEVAEIERQIKNLSLTSDVVSLMQEEIANPLDVKEFAKLAKKTKYRDRDIFSISHHLG